LVLPGQKIKVKYLGEKGTTVEKEVTVEEGPHEQIIIPQEEIVEPKYYASETADVEITRHRRGGPPPPTPKLEPTPEEPTPPKPEPTETPVEYLISHADPSESQTLKTTVEDTTIISPVTTGVTTESYIHRQQAEERFRKEAIFAQQSLSQAEREEFREKFVDEGQIRDTEGALEYLLIYAEPSNIERLQSSIEQLETSHWEISPEVQAGIERQQQEAVTKAYESLTEEEKKEFAKKFPELVTKTKEQLAFEAEREAIRSRMTGTPEERVAEMARFVSGTLIKPGTFLRTTAQVVKGGPEAGERILDILAEQSVKFKGKDIPELFIESYKPGGFGFIATAAALLYGVGKVGLPVLAALGVGGKILATGIPLAVGGGFSAVAGAEIGKTFALEEAKQLPLGAGLESAFVYGGHFALFVGTGTIAAKGTPTQLLKPKPGREGLTLFERPQFTRIWSASRSIAFKIRFKLSKLTGLPVYGSAKGMIGSEPGKWKDPMPAYGMIRETGTQVFTKKVPVKYPGEGYYLEYEQTSKIELPVYGEWELVPEMRAISQVTGFGRYFQPGIPGKYVVGHIGRPAFIGYNEAYDTFLGKVETLGMKDTFAYAEGKIKLMDTPTFTKKISLARTLEGFYPSTEMELRLKAFEFTGQKPIFARSWLWIKKPIYSWEAFGRGPLTPSDIEPFIMPTPTQKISIIPTGEFYKFISIEAVSGHTKPTITGTAGLGRTIKLYTLHSKFKGHKIQISRYGTLGKTVTPEGQIRFTGKGTVYDLTEWFIPKDGRISPSGVRDVTTSTHMRVFQGLQMPTPPRVSLIGKTIPTPSIGGLRMDVSTAQIPQISKVVTTTQIYTPSPLFMEKTTVEQITKPTLETITKSITKQITKPITEVTIKPITEVATKPTTKQITKPITETITKPVTEVITKPMTETIVKPVTKTITEQITKPITSVIVHPITRTIEKTITSPPPPPPIERPPPPTKIIWWWPPQPLKEIERELGKQGFNVFVRERRFFKGKEVKEGKFIQINAVPLTEFDALSLGGTATDRSAARTFKIEKTSSKPKKLSIEVTPWNFIQLKFVKKDDRFIEQNFAAIDTLEEVEGISALGWVAERRKQQRIRKIRKEKPIETKDMYDSLMFDLDEFDRLFRRLGYGF
jgi:hypothetical protein